MPALLLIDGFDKYGTPGMSATLTAGDWATFSASTVGNSLNPAGVGYAVGFNIGGGSTSNTFSAVSRIVGTVRVGSNVSASITLRNGATAAFTIQLSVAGGLVIRTGTSSGSVIASGGTYAGTNSVITFDVTIGASSSYAVYLDGSLILSGTGNTGNGQSSVNTLQLASSANTTYFDDLALFDPTNSNYNSGVLTANAVVETQFGNGDNQTQFVNDGDVVLPAGISLQSTYRVGSTTTAPGANQIVLLKITPNLTRTLNNVLMWVNTTSATAKFKAVLYSDSAGSPNALLSDGIEVVGCTSGGNVIGALVTPQTITAGTSYWIGFYMDTAITIQAYDNLSSNLGQRKANTYTSGAPGTLTGMTTGQFTYYMWGNCTGSTQNYLALSRNPPVASDLSQVHSATVGNEDLFNFPAMLTTPSAIYGGAVKVYANKSDAGTRTMNINMKSGATDANGTNTAIAISTTFQWWGSVFDVDPATGTAWTASGVNNAKSGYSVNT